MPKRTSQSSATARGGDGSGNVLDLRALNRATLERQMLLRRQKLPAEEAIEHLVGMQAQSPNPPYVGLWTRLEGFHPDELARLGEVTERLRSRLLTFRDEHGKELFDLPDAPRPDPDTLAPPRFLPEFDNLILSHADRTRIISGGYRKVIASKNGMVPATVLTGGFVRGRWKTERTTRGKAALVIELFELLPKEDSEALAAEGERLIRFMAEPEGAEAFEVRFAERI